MISILDSSRSDPSFSPCIKPSSKEVMASANKNCPDVVYTDYGPSVMWKQTNTSSEHRDCWIDAEKYRGEEVEEAHWSCCGSSNKSGPGCVIKTQACAQVCAQVSQYTSSASSSSSSGGGRRHTGVWGDRETYHGEVVAEAGWTCCGSKQENSTSCS